PRAGQPPNRSASYSVVEPRTQRPEIQENARLQTSAGTRPRPENRVGRAQGFRAPRTPSEDRTRQPDLGSSPCTGRPGQSGAPGHGTIAGHAGARRGTGEGRPDPRSPD